MQITNDIKIYKTIARRFFAGLIDSLIYYYISSLLFFALCFITNIKLPLPVYWTIYLFVSFTTTIILTKVYNGTIGKWYFNVKVINTNCTENIKWIQSIYREIINIGMYILYIMPMYFYWYQNGNFDYEKYFSKDHPTFIVSLITILYCIVSVSEILTSLFNEQRRAIHDFLGETVVVINGKYRLLSKTITIIIYIIGIAIYMRIFEFIKK